MQRNSLFIPLAIVIAGALVAGAVYFTNNSSGTNNQNTDNGPADIVIRPIDSTDHIIGNPNAPIKVVEYSDTECPFCKNFHQTMNQIMETYGRDGKVAWVYRHFPIPQLHSKAPRQAEATECAAELGGNDGFWKFTNRLYEITPSNNGLEDSQLPQIAQFAGLDVAKFNECLSSGRHTAKIEAAYDEAIAAGAQGTPYSIILTSEDETPIPLEGAQPYSAVKSVIDTILAAQAN